MDEVLANLLQNYPAIWNRQSQDFKNNLKKENSFKELATILNTTVENVQARCKYLREKYRKEKEKKETLTRSGAGAPDSSEEWYLFNTLAFFDKVMLKRRTKSNLPLQTVQSCGDNNIDEPEPGPSNKYPRMECTENIQYNEYSDSENIEPEIGERLIETPIREQIQKNKSPRFLKKGKMDTVMERLVTAAEKISKRPTVTNSVPIENESKFTYIGKFIAKSLSELDDDLADEAVLQLVQLITEFKKQQQQGMVQIEDTEEF